MSRAQEQVGKDIKREIRLFKKADVLLHYAVQGNNSKKVTEYFVARQNHEGRIELLRKEQRAIRKEIV